MSKSSEKTKKREAEKASESAEEKVEEPTGVETEASAEQTETASDQDAAEPAAESAQPEAATGEKNSEEEESYKDQYLRLRADFENFRKRTRREKEEWTQRCLENLCGDLLTVLDHFDLGIENSEGKEFTQDTLQGFKLVRGQLETTLKKYGLSAITATEGAFDPNLHEAITHLPSPEVPEDHIVAMTRKGYQLGNRLLRPAQVVVSAGAGEPAAETETAGETN